ncbi:MAG: hypothetical protein J6H31_02740 [Butyrivibrio sp.]|nr:hypothetical protein [Butyrivibrio sp.]
MKVEGKTTSGFKYEVNSEAFSTWDYIEATAMTQSENEGEQVQGYVRMVKLTMGKDGMKKLREHLGENMQFADVNREVTEITQKVVKEVKEVKNSQSLQQ